MCQNLHETENEETLLVSKNILEHTILFLMFNDFVCKLNK